MYFPDLKKQVERDYETDLENEAVNEAWTDAINAVAGSLDYQGAYHVWENGYERGDADDDDILADAVRFDIIKSVDQIDPVTLQPITADAVEDAVMRILDENLHERYHDALVELATGALA
ncbi:MAG TPA: hypothetical protein DCP69_07170 [Candidatus Omnitrophica bacterium]|nr:hypothetical protein [Candidatus Omnitrophota bacterium]